MAFQQGALSRLSYPKATCDPATKEIVDTEFELSDIGNQLVDVAATLAAERGNQPAASAAERLLRFLGNLAKMKPNLAIVAEFE